MRKVSAGTLLFILSIYLTQAVVSAQEEKPLEPGWLSLDSTVGIGDKAIADGKSTLEKALGININGFLGAGWNFSTNHPRNPDQISLRYFDQDQNKLVFNAFNLTLDKPEKDWGVGIHLSGLFGRTGELLREATLWGNNFHHEPSAELYESYLTTTLPVGEGLQIKGGLFVTLLGTEVIYSPGAYNENISRSFLFNLAIPFRHLGMLFSYPVHKTVNLTAGVVTGWDDPHDNNHMPSFMGSVGFTPSDKVALNTSFIYGPEQDNRNGPKRFTIANVLSIKPIDPLQLYLEYTYGHEANASLGGTRDATWQGFAGVAAYSWTDRFTTAFRGEWFNDRDGARIGGNFNGTHANVQVGEITFTGAYKFTKMLLGRAEVRQDWSDRNVFQKSSSRADSAQTTIAMELIYTF